MNSCTETPWHLANGHGNLIEPTSGHVGPLPHHQATGGKTEGQIIQSFINGHRWSTGEKPLATGVNRQFLK